MLGGSFFFYRGIFSNFYTLNFTHLMETFLNSISSADVSVAVILELHTHTFISRDLQDKIYKHQTAMKLRVAGKLVTLGSEGSYFVKSTPIASQTNKNRQQRKDHLLPQNGPQDPLVDNPSVADSHPFLLLKSLSIGLPQSKANSHITN